MVDSFISVSHHDEIFPTHEYFNLLPSQNTKSLRGARITTYICTLLDGFVVPYDNCSFFQEGELQQLYYEVPQCCSTFVDFQFEKQSHNSSLESWFLVD